LSSTERQLRDFGLLVGGIFAVIGLWPLIVRGGAPRVWAVVAGAGLILPAFVAPGLLRPIHRFWMGLANALGWFNTRLILGTLFLVLITPVGLIRRLFHRDPLGLEFRPDMDTYRVPRQPRAAEHMRHQF